MKEGQRVFIQFFDGQGQVVGDNSVSLTSFPGTLVRRDNIMPIAIPDRKHIVREGRPCL